MRKRLKAEYSEGSGDQEVKSTDDIYLSPIELAYIKNLAINKDEDEIFSDIFELPKNVL